LAISTACVEHLLVHVDLVGWETGRGNRRRKSRLAVLCAAPHLALIGRDERRGVHRLHRRVVLVRIRINRFDLLGSAFDGGFDVAILVANESLFGVETGLEEFGDRRAVVLFVSGGVPLDR
jgi:hypothetical protein